MNVAYFFPHPFYPVKTGAHVRVLQALGSLNRLGHNVFCAFLHHDSFPHESRYERDLSLLCEEIYFYKYSRIPDNPKRILTAKANFASGLFCVKSFHDFFSRVDSTMRRWMEEVLSHSEADVVYVPYPSYRSILPLNMQPVCILELYDTDALNWDMQVALQSYLIDGLGNLKPIGRDSRCLHRSFFPDTGVELTAEEAHCIRSFDAAIGLTERDHSLLRDLGHSLTSCIPIMTEPAKTLPDYSGGQPCMMMGPNYFNLQGLLHLSHCVLPHVTATSPEFRVDLYGSVPHGGAIELDGRIRNRGFVADISSALQESSFFINPVFSGTGMQIKTVEAMAHGLAIVCYEEIAEAAGVQHGVNGYVAKSEEDFASGIALLSRDRLIVQEWGIAARDHVSRNLSQKALDEKMGEFMRTVHKRCAIS